MNDSDYPVTIELGRKESNGPVAPMPAGKKGKPRMYYPTLYIDSVPGLEQLPKEGCIMVRYRRKSLRLEENYEGKETAGATLEIHALCLPESSEDGETLEDAFKKIGKGEVAEDNDEYADDE